MKNATRRYLRLSSITCWALFLGFSLGFIKVNAQSCEHVGWVESSSVECGVVILDLDTGEKMRAFEGSESLVAGKTICFSSSPAALPSSCTATDLSVIRIDEISYILPCTAGIMHEVSAGNPLRVKFTAKVYDADVQICEWKFSDGAVASGREVSHTFESSGFYQVILTVHDDQGCSITKTKNIYLSNSATALCNLDMTLTAVGQEIYGRVAVDPYVDAQIGQVKWYLARTSQVLAETPEFVAPVPQNDGSIMVCADITTSDADLGGTCNQTLCKTLVMTQPDCVQPMMTADLLCGPASVPVCGCNNVTYKNECDAIASGVRMWWAGACDQSSSTCHANLEVQKINGNPISGGFWVTFKNHSTGAFGNTQLDFGDGTDMWQGANWDTIAHYYERPGHYRTNLSVWQNDACLSTATMLLATDAAHGQVPPEMTDYVMPGDANDDGVSNVYDLLQLGLGYFHDGVPRPNAHTAWLPQFAPEWSDKVSGNGVNFKHMDSDGNGTINLFDTDPIEQHYVSLPLINVPFEQTSPQIRLEFPNLPDTIVVSSANTQSLQIQADLIAGSNTRPLLGVHGIAMAIEYPEAAEHHPEVDYDDNSFLGFTNHILMMPHDNHAKRQLDLGITRITGSNTGGYGRIASINFVCDFIIIVDIIERTGNNIVPFTLPVRSIRAINKDGQPLDISVPDIQDTVWIKFQGASPSATPTLADQSISVSPNPVRGKTTIHCDRLTMEKVEIINAFGQVVATFKTPAANLEMDTSDWSSGVYTVRIATDQGSTEKRLVVP